MTAASITTLQLLCTKHYRFMRSFLILVLFSSPPVSLDLDLDPASSLAPDHSTDEMQIFQNCRQNSFKNIIFVNLISCAEAKNKKSINLVKFVSEKW